MISSEENRIVAELAKQDWVRPEPQAKKKESALSLWYRQRQLSLDLQV